MENIVLAIITGIVTIILAIIGVQQRRNTSNIIRNKSEIETEVRTKTKIDTPKLIETLNNTVRAQTDQIQLLREIVDEQRVQLQEKNQQLDELTKRVSKLEQLTIEQALIIRGLERGKSRRVQQEGGETQSHE